MLRSNRLQAGISLLMAFFSCLAFSVEIARGAEEYAARVTRYNGAVTVERGFDTLEVAMGFRLMVDDELRTGPDGSVGIVFNDETTMALGPGSRLTIQDYVFAPDRSRFSFVVRLLKGTATYVSGLISKISPDAVKFITPSTSIGVRGTKFLIEVEAK